SPLQLYIDIKNTRSGLVILERILPNGSEQAGIYAQGNRLLEAVSMFGFLFAGLLLPMFSRMIKEKQQVTQLLRLSSLMLIVPSIILSIVSLCYRNEIMHLLYHEVHKNTAIIFALLMFSFIGIGNTYIFGSLLTANGSLRKLNIMAAVGVVLNVSLNLVLIPIYDAMGMAIATLTTQIYAATAQILIAKYEFNIKVNYFLILKLIVFGTAVFFIAHYSKLLSYNWIISLAIVGLISFLLACITRLISLKALISILKSE
ncbi:MAG: polysaccharide biosynthesis C-terminal domain-containing protein, partial [Bacteroidota bacterium]|nr:polysaccharide biosynthesis C-terminal domain-containing protein [Bacteroidota bacterium]